MFLLFIIFCFFVFLFRKQIAAMLAGPQAAKIEAAILQPTQVVPSTAPPDPATAARMMEDAKRLIQTQLEKSKADVLLLEGAMKASSPTPAS